MTAVHLSRRPTAEVEPHTVYTVASGDLRPSANVDVLADAAAAGGRPHAPPSPSSAGRCGAATPSTPATGHGFIGSQRAGIEVFKDIPPDAPLIVAEAVWQYSHHVLAGPAHPPRPDPHRRQLAPATWPGPGRPAQPQRAA